MFCTALVLATTMVVGQAENKPSSQLNEYAAVVVGEWTGVGTLSYDIPGVGTKGDKLTGTSTTKWVLDKAAIQCDWKFGGATGKWIVIWDAEKKVLRACHVNSTGNFSVGTISKQGNDWIEKAEGASGEGKHFSGTSIIATADNGNTVIYDETEQMLGGEKQPAFRHEWKRVSK